MKAQQHKARPSSQRSKHIDEFDPSGGWFAAAMRCVHFTPDGQLREIFRDRYDAAGNLKRRAPS